MSKKIADLLIELYRLTKGTPLGGVLLETVGAAQEHGDLTVRLGTNSDRTFSIYAYDRSVGQSVTQFLVQRTVPRLYFMPEMAQVDFEIMLRNPDVVVALGGEATDEVVTEHWPRLSAMAYLKRLSAQMKVMKPEQSEELLKQLTEPFCAISEGRFRSLLNDVLGWKAPELNQAVEEVLKQDG